MPNFSFHCTVLFNSKGVAYIIKSCLKLLLAQPPSYFILHVCLAVEGEAGSTAVQEESDRSGGPPGRGYPGTDCSPAAPAGGCGGGWSQATASEPGKGPGKLWKEINTVILCMSTM